MEEGGFNYWNNLLRGPEAAADESSSLPPPLSSDGWAGINDQCPTHLDGSWALDEDQQSMMLGVGGDDIFFTAGTNGSLPLDIEDPRLFGDECLPDQAGAADEELLDFDLDLDIDSLFDGTSSGVAPGFDSSGTSQASADSQPQASADQPWGMLPMGSNALLDHTQVEADSPPAAPATDEDGAGDMMMTLADMIRIAEECGKDQAAGRVWSGEEHQHLLHCLQLFAKHDGPNRCFHTSTSLHNKTALDVALRYRWLQDKEKHAKQAQLVQKDSAGVKVNKKNSSGQGQGTKGAKKNSNMYPLSKEALDSKSTRELLRDSYIFMQQIEENIKSGKLGDNTADYFYYVKTNIDAIGKRENGFCRMSMPMPPIDEQGLEEILHQSRHSSSSAGKEAA
ncbi:unnamed protein product [Urochloa decumbens]|uniref:Uncharacterized protein n=1 Tax=Urochloa decumbens TaxID=240449 RepID=A0ABC8WM05_9POAL